MSERNPAGAYRQQRPGEHPGRFETDAQVWRAPNTPAELIQYVNAGRAEYTPVVTIEATKPDARITLRLTIGFVEVGDVDLEDVFDGRAFADRLTDTLIWISECDEWNGGLREAGDLVGTRAVPVPMISRGNYGQIFEVDVDCKAVRARITCATPGAEGRFYVNAKWVAVSPMSDRDWQHARQRMQVNVKSAGIVTTAPEPEQ